MATPKEIRKRKSYSDFKTLALLLNNAQEGEAEFKAALMKVHDMIDARRGFGSETNSKAAIESIELLCSDLNDDTRRCDACNVEMDEGYCIDQGSEYYCSDECLHTKYTPKEWEEMYTDGGDSYWTQWE